MIIYGVASPVGGSNAIVIISVLMMQDLKFEPLN